MRTIKRLLPGLLLLAALLLFNAETAFACSCVAATPQENAERADVIFLGTVAEAALTNRGVLTSSVDPIRVTFDVQTVYKGDADDVLTLETARDGASCGYDFQVGDSYLVYARETDGELTTDLCSGTKPEFEATADLTHLGGGTVVGLQDGLRFPLWIGIVLAAGLVALLLAWLFSAIYARTQAKRGRPTPY